MKMTLKAARVNVGYTQKQVADKLEVSERAVVNWETGKNCISAENLKRLSYLYNLKMDDFLLPNM
jgi:DNA-binding XRE family transcriptional regulator